ncbi:MAG: hypothetical protein JOZ69_07695, partial [Myxococcales bacterium]|nr:hypothetical protein [Myxococcales bacterium]
MAHALDRRGARRILLWGYRVALAVVFVTASIYVFGAKLGLPTVEVFDPRSVLDSIERKDPELLDTSRMYYSGPSA